MYFPASKVQAEKRKTVMVSGNVRAAGVQAQPRDWGSTGDRHIHGKGHTLPSLSSALEIFRSTPGVCGMIYNLFSKTMHACRMAASFLCSGYITATLPTQLFRN